MSAKTFGDSGRSDADRSIMRPRSSGTVGDWTIITRAPRHRGSMLKDATRRYNAAHGIEDGDADFLETVRRPMKKAR